ncbi:hypothetical protein Tco_0117134 [Tanacetum coccineum]
MVLVHSDDMAKLMGRITSSTSSTEDVLLWRRNDLATDVFPFLSKAALDPSTPIEALLSKKLISLCHPTLSKTFARSKVATPSPPLLAKALSPTAKV